MGKGHSNLYSLGLMRVFASLMVVIYHFDNMVTVKYGHSPFGDTFALGAIGNKLSISEMRKEIRSLAKDFSS